MEGGEGVPDLRNLPRRRVIGMRNGSVLIQRAFLDVFLVCLSNFYPGKSCRSVICITTNQTTLTTGCDMSISQENRKGLVVPRPHQAPSMDFQ